MVLIPSFRDSSRCSETLISLFGNASEPDAIRISIFDQILSNETTCLEEYCKKEKECRKEQIFNSSMNSQDATGPTYARYETESKISDEDFCLAIDSHSLFIKNWDREAIYQWEMTENPYAILTGYPKGTNVRGSRYDTDDMQLQCVSRIESADADSMVQYAAPIWIDKPKQPRLMSQLAGGFSFGNCVQAKTIRNDPYTPYLFHGEEYSRAARLWTNGYDFYTPTTDIVYHWYERRHYYWEIDWSTRWFIQQSSKRRIRAALHMNYTIDDFDHTDLERFSLGNKRTFEQWISFTKINPYASFIAHNASQFENCGLLDYIPFNDNTATVT